LRSRFTAHLRVLAVKVHQLKFVRALNSGQPRLRVQPMTFNDQHLHDAIPARPPALALGALGVRRSCFQRRIVRHGGPPLYQFNPAGVERTISTISVRVFFVVAQIHRLTGGARIVANSSHDFYLDYSIVPAKKKATL
jgi:hypothetical protein